MEIILGVFRSATYKHLENEGFRPFFKFFSCKEISEIKSSFGTSPDMVEIICKFAASEHVKTIHFSLDDLMFPFSSFSVTNEELSKILNEPEALAKTRFYQDCKEVDKEEVLYFLNEHFHTKNSTEEVQSFPKFQTLNVYE